MKQINDLDEVEYLYAQLNEHVYEIEDDEYSFSHYKKQKMKLYDTIQLRESICYTDRYRDSYFAMRHICSWEALADYPQWVLAWHDYFDCTTIINEDTLLHYIKKNIS